MTGTDGNEEGDVLEMADKDWLLTAFVQEANSRGKEFIAVTLNVGGLIISGIMVGAKEYYRSVAKTFIPQGKEPAQGTWGEFLLKCADEVKVEYKDGSYPDVSYIHLKDARIHTNGALPLPTNEGVWWRGKLSSVDAFWIGRLRVSNDD